MARRIEKSGLPGLKKQQKVRDGIKKRQLDYLLLRFHRVAAKFVERERERIKNGIMLNFYKLVPFIQVCKW